jgi:hypothetical protein
VPAEQGFDVKRRVCFSISHSSWTYVTPGVSAKVIARGSAFQDIHQSLAADETTATRVNEMFPHRA